MAKEKFENQPTTSPREVPQMPAQVSIERASNYDVYDAKNERIGSTTALWMDRYNQPAFIGIKTTWLVGKTHVIPAWGAEVNHQAERIRVGCPKEVIENAPSFSPDQELGYEEERQIMDYFKSRGSCQPRVATTPGTEETRATETRATEARTGEETVIPLHEEQVKVGKREVETGGVRLRKVVRTETVQQPVELRREEVEIERVPATGERRASEKAFQGEDVYIPLRREEAVVEKEAHVREEVRARKTAGTERQTVSGEVRKEDVEVQREQPRRKAA